MRAVSPRPHCLAASTAMRLHRERRALASTGRTTLRSAITGTIRLTPSSVASRTIASSLSPFPSACTSVTARGATTSAARAPSIRTRTDRPELSTITASASIACSGSNAVNTSPSPSRCTRAT